MALLHRPLTRATADAKVVNFGSNLAAVAFFASRGSILWSVALPMAGAQLVGGFVGAHLAVRRGDRNRYEVRTRFYQYHPGSGPDLAGHGVT